MVEQVVVSEREGEGEGNVESEEEGTIESEEEGNIESEEEMNSLPTLTITGSMA